MPRLTTSKKSTGFRIVFCMYLSKAVMSKIRDAKFLYGYFSARSLKLKHVILQRIIQTERCSDICCSGGCCKLVFLFSIIKRIFDIFKKHQKKQNKCILLNRIYPFIFIFIWALTIRVAKQDGISGFYFKPKAPNVPIIKNGIHFSK